MQATIVRLTHGFWSKLLLLLADVLGLIVLFNIAHHARVGRLIDWQSLSFWAIVVITVITLYVLDVYRTDKPSTRIRLPLQAFMAVPMAGAFSTLYIYTLGVGAFESVYGRGVMPAAFIAFAFWAAFWRWLLVHLQIRYTPAKQWLTICENNVFEQLKQASTAQQSTHQWHHFAPDQSPSTLQKAVAKINLKADWGMVVFNQSQMSDELAKAVMQYRFLGVTVLSLSEFYEQYWSRVPVLHLDSGWFVESTGFQWVNDQIGLRFQRILDIIVSTSGLLIGTPLLLLIALLVKLSSTGPVLFVQTRTGLLGKPFQLIKFRTMVEDAEKDGAQWATINDPRITTLGRFLRLSRLDELPQLWNILKGEMSLIGPRPERPEFIQELEQKIPFYDLRHMVVPGVTGWAQVMYPYGASVEDARKKLEYDLYYIKNHSIQLDFTILIKTILVIFKQAGR